MTSLKRSMCAPLPLLLLLALATAFPTAVTAVILPDLRDIQRENLKLERFALEVEDIVRRALARGEALENRLADEEINLDGARVDAEMLRAARLDLDSMQSRLAVMEGRIEQRTLVLARLATQVEELQADLATSDGLDTERLRKEAGLDLLRAQQKATESNVNALGMLITAARRNAELLTQRLRLLQSRLQLGNIDTAALQTQDKRIAMLETVIGDFLARATRTDREADAIVGTGPKELERRRVVAMSGDDAVTRGFLRQNDLELVLAGNRLGSLVALRDDSTMPLHVLEGGQRKLGEIEQTLERIGASLEVQVGVLESKLTALRRGGASDGPEIGMAHDLRSLMDFQKKDIEELKQRVADERTIYDRVIGEAHAASLLDHRPLPSAASDWRRIGASALHLPRLFAGSLALVAEDLGGRAVQAAQGLRILVGLGAPFLVGLMLWGARRLKTPEQIPEDRRYLAMTLDALSHALPAAIPAAVWLLAALAFEVPRQMLVPVLALLGLWPVLAFVSRLTREGLLGDLARGGRRLPDEAEYAFRVRFCQRLRLGLWVAGALAFLFVLTHALPIAPLLADLLDRLGMLGLLALMIPALALRDLISRQSSHSWSNRPRALRFFAPLSRVLPVFVLATGLIGLAGYTNLAWELTAYFLWLLLVALVLFFAAGLLADLGSRLSARLEVSDPERAAFWRTHFVEPGHRLGLLAAFAGGGWLLFTLWGWNVQTPAVRWAQGLVNTVLFRIGEAPFTVGDILTALILVAAALWVGGWSQQVSYQLAYRRVRDQGLRQALATFTQYVVIVAGVLLALKIIGFDLTTLTVFAASLGVGIGFGMQNIVNNFISGILLLAERPLRIGDYVSIGPHQGNVTQIGIRSLTVRTPDKQEVVIPNGEVISKEFTNWTRSDDTVRDVQYVHVRYDSDRERAIDLIKAALADQPDVLKDPPPGVFLDGYAERGARIRFHFCFRFVHGPGTFATRSAVLLEIGRRFAENGIAFAELYFLPPVVPAE